MGLGETESPKGTTTIVVCLDVAVGATAVVPWASEWGQPHGHVNWGWKGAGGAALAGGVGAMVGMGALAVLGGAAGAVGGGAIAGGLGGAASGATGAAVGGGGWGDIGKGALLGAVAGAAGGTIGVLAGSASENGWAAFGGTMAGTGAGTATGIGFGWAAFGQDPTWQSAGIAFASAFGGAIASTSLSEGWASAVEGETGGAAKRETVIEIHEARAELVEGDRTERGGLLSLLDANGDGTYHVNGKFMEMCGNEFQKQLGFDPLTARIKFGYAWGSPAYTYKNTITIDPNSEFGSWYDPDQAELLLHELTHSLQYKAMGAAVVMARTAIEKTWVWMDRYEPNDVLVTIKDLRFLDVRQVYFTIESVATHVARTLSPEVLRSGAARKP
jgi:hypothetical protein